MAAAATWFYRAGSEADEEEEPASDPPRAALESLRNTSVREVMTSEVISVAGDDPIHRIAEVMRSRRIHRVLVIEDGKLAGIVSSLDIVGVVADAD